MIDIRLIRKDRDAVEKKLKYKDPSIDLSRIVQLDESIRHLKTRVEELKAERNEASKQIGELKRQGKDASSIMDKVASFAHEVHTLDHRLSEEEKEFHHLMGCLPNIPEDRVKVAQDPKENVLLKSVGKKREFDFVPKNHVELNEKFGLFDFPRGAKVSGAGWPTYRGLGARLEWALINYMLETQIKNGFEQWMPPIAVKREAMFASGNLPKFENQAFKVTDEDYDLFLIPTSEVALNSLHADEIIDETLLPIKYASYTPCFRREAGAAGANERGLIRVHQFNKVEMFAFTKPEESKQMHDLMIASAEEILDGLELHYRSMALVTGDMSFGSAYTVDIEVWLPGQNRYYEVSSVSNCTDFQARRANIRYRPKGDKPEFVHTLNGSGLATSRLMVALLENNQNADGSIKLPKVLQERLGLKQLG